MPLAAWQRKECGTDIIWKYESTIVPPYFVPKIHGSPSLRKDFGTGYIRMYIQSSLYVLWIARPKKLRSEAGRAFHQTVNRYPWQGLLCVKVARDHEGHRGRFLHYFALHTESVMYMCTYIYSSEQAHSGERRSEEMPRMRRNKWTREKHTISFFVLIRKVLMRGNLTGGAYSN